ncbi:MAG: hypothetical protein KAG61_11485 [Bacteriovoracaceae bacterium]|nr:hypothetical protein [Bacteriovoracaceae bacterium]
MNTIIGAKVFPISNLAQNAGFLIFAGLCFFIKSCMHLYRNSFGIGNPYTFSLQVIFAIICFYYATRFFYSFQRGDRVISLDGNVFYFPGAQVSHPFRFYNGLSFGRDEIRSVTVSKRWPFPTFYFVRITLKNKLTIRLTNFTVAPSEYTQLLSDLRIKSK